MLEDIKFTAGWGWAVTDCMEVAAQLEEVVVVLGLVGGIKIVSAAFIWEFICAKFACGQVEFEYLGKCCNQICLLLQAG